MAKPSTTAQTSIPSPTLETTNASLLTPEAYPADAKITPGAEQINTSASQAVGQASAPTPEAQAVDDSIAAAIAEADNAAG